MCGPSAWDTMRAMTSGSIEISAAVCRGFGTPLSVERLRLAPPEGSEIRVRVRASSICHSDITCMDGGWGGADSLPAVFGHELAGVVTDLGPSVPPGSICVGERVLVSLLRSCGRCERCEAGSPAQCTAAFGIDSAPRLSDAEGRPVLAGLRVGGFAESAVVDVSQAVTIPAEVADEAACLVSCGVMTGFGAAINTARVQAGDAVAVIGCGGVGLNCVQGAALAGALPLVAIDLDSDKLAQARAFGATDALDATREDVAAEALALTEGRGFDVVMTAVGSARAIEQALPLLARDGALVVVGMPPCEERVSLDATTLAHFGQRILGCKMGDARLRVDAPRLFRLYRAGRLRLDELVASRRPLAEINEAISEARRSQGLRHVIVFPDRPRSGTTGTGR